MKRFILLLFVMVGLVAQAGVGAIILTPKGPADNRSGNTLYYDKLIQKYDIQLHIFISFTY